MDNLSNACKSQPRFLTPKQFVEQHKFMPMGGLRHLIFNAEQNGFDKVIFRIGNKKILISEEAFFEWLKERNRK